jgi:excisionase family DNA binding protein
MKNNNLDVLTLQEAASLMRVSKMTVYRLVYSRRIPFTRVGSKLLFLKNDIEAFLNKNRVNASF